MCYHVSSFFFSLMHFANSRLYLLQVISDPLAFQFRLLGLQRRRRRRVEQDVSVLQILLFGARLEVLLEPFAALGGVDGGLVDGRVAGRSGLFVRHDLWPLLRL